MNSHSFPHVSIRSNPYVCLSYLRASSAEGSDFFSNRDRHSCCVIESDIHSSQFSSLSSSSEDEELVSMSLSGSVASGGAGSRMLILRTKKFMKSELKQNVSIEIPS